LARTVCSAHYQIARRSGIELPKRETLNSEDVYRTILGKGKMTASEVGELIECSERHARRFLKELVEEAKVEQIKGGENGKADLWVALADPVEEIRWEVERLLREATTIIISVKGPRQVYAKDVLQAANRIREAFDRLHPK
jgi:predicted ArsR family transcriptional regulator